MSSFLGAEKVGLGGLEASLAISVHHDLLLRLL